MSVPLNIWALACVHVPPPADDDVISSSCGCTGIVISCLRDGSFLCAVETRCGLQSHEAPLACRVHVVNLRPAAGCAVAVPSGCELDQDHAYAVSEEDAPLPDSLDKESIGRLIVDSVMRSRHSERPLPAHLASAFPVAEDAGPSPSPSPSPLRSP